MGQLQLQQCFYTSAYPIFKKTHSVDTLCTYNMYNTLTKHFHMSGHFDFPRHMLVETASAVAV